MNERIIELWEKAQTCVIDTDCSDYHERLQLKFAELIVRECASLIESEKDYYSNSMTIYEYSEHQKRMAAKVDALDDAARMIKSHFGVE